MFRHRWALKLDVISKVISIHLVFEVFLNEQINIMKQKKIAIALIRYLNAFE